MTILGESVPKMKLPPAPQLPTPSLGAVLNRLGALGLTVLAFVLLQKLGLAASEYWNESVAPISDTPVAALPPELPAPFGTDPV